MIPLFLFFFFLLHPICDQSSHDVYILEAIHAHLCSIIIVLLIYRILAFFISLREMTGIALLLPTLPFAKILAYRT